MEHTHTHTHSLSLRLTNPAITALTSDRSPHTSTRVHSSRRPQTRGGRRRARALPQLPSAAHLPSVGPEGEAALPAAHGAARAEPSRCPRPGHLGNPRRPTPGHKPRDCPRPRGLRASCPGQPRAERAACSGRPRAGLGDGAGDSLDFPSGDLGAGRREGRAGPRRWRRGGERGGQGPSPTPSPDPGRPGLNTLFCRQHPRPPPPPTRSGAVP